MYIAGRGGGKWEVERGGWRWEEVGRGGGGGGGGVERGGER